jgi:hypothetical protein
MARNDLILIADQDILFFDNSLIEEMLETMKDENVYACGTQICGFNEGPFLVPSCVMLNRKLFLENEVFFDGGGNPCFAAFFNAQNKGQKLIFIDPKDRLFHLSYGVRRPYPQLLLMKQWQYIFENWKLPTGSSANLEDYVIDDGMDIEDHNQLNNLILSQLDTAINFKHPFSLIRLGDLGLRYLDGYLNNKVDFTHVGAHHPDIAMPNDEIGSKLIIELINNMNEAEYIDHPHTYKGTLGDLYNWRGVLGNCDNIYKQAGITKHKNYCSSVQSYLSLIEDFEWSMHSILKDRKIIFAAPYDALSTLNSRKNLGMKEFKFYPLSLSADHWDRYNVMNKFFDSFDPNYWDLVLVSGSLYGRTIIGRVRKMGGRAFDIGQAIHFNPNNIFEGSFKTNEDKTYFKIIDHYNGKKEYLKYERKINE